MSTELPSNTRALLARSVNAPELIAFSAWLGSEHYTPFVVQRHLLRLEQVLPRLPGPTCKADDLHAAFNAVGCGVPSWVFRTNVTAGFGIVTEDFGPS